MSFLEVESALWMLARSVMVTAAEQRHCHYVSYSVRRSCDLEYSDENDPAERAVRVWQAVAEAAGVSGRCRARNLRLRSELA
jgi:hypothetical protein